MVIGWSQILREGFFALDASATRLSPGADPRKSRPRRPPLDDLAAAAPHRGDAVLARPRALIQGDILVQRELALRPDETVTTLYAKQLELLRELLATALPLLESGSPPRHPQPQTGASYCAKRTADDGLD